MPDIMFWLRRWWVPPLLVGGLIALLAGLQVWPLVQLDRLLYDRAMQLSYRNPNVTRDVALIEYGLEDLSTLAAFPGPRGHYAELIRRLSVDGAKAVALMTPLDRERPLPEWFEDLHRALPTASAGQGGGEFLERLRTRIEAARFQLDVDAQLRSAMASFGNVFLPFYFGPPAPADVERQPVPDYVLGHFIPTAQSADPQRLLSNEGGGWWSSPLLLPAEAQVPAPAFGERARALGFTNHRADSDGVIRSQPLAMRYGDLWYPSLALALVAPALSLDDRDIRIEPGEGLWLADRYIRTDADMRLRVGFYAAGDDDPTFSTYSISEVLGEPMDGRFRGKIVFIGPGAVQGQNTFATPVAEGVSQLALQANLLVALTNADYYQVPPWASAVRWLALALAVAAGAALLPRLALWPGVIVAVVLGIVFTGVSVYLMIGPRLWVGLGSPIMVMLLTAAVAVLQPTVVPRLRLRRDGGRSQADSQQDDRMTARDLEGQGKLEQALAVLLRLDSSAEDLEALYRLGGALERRGALGPAIKAYERILMIDNQFKDALARKRRAETLLKNSTQRVRGVHRGGIAQAAQAQVAQQRRQRPAPPPDTAASEISQPGAQRSSLGRYQIEGMIGRGAMGVVYRGVDPRINRVVAIKTLALQEEFEADELGEVRERFFHEARVAGKLSHPNIVTIYDVGEEDDLAFIAMEFLDGTDIRRFVRKDKRLPVNRIMEIGAQIAEALDYAHKQGVVHRDIKPSNVILDSAGRNIKVVDFGIARIGASGKTRTGTVMGTPPYMSPEQLAGRSVDGRSDIFSLAVLLFELVAGRRPFEGDSVAALMMKIANERHPDIMSLRGGVPACFRNILDKALQKNPDKRFQTAAAMRLALLRCISNNYTGTGSGSLP